VLGLLLIGVVLLDLFMGLLLVLEEEVAVEVEVLTIFLVTSEACL